MGYRSVHLPAQTHHIATQLVKRDLEEVLEDYIQGRQHGVGKETQHSSQNKPIKESLLPLNVYVEIFLVYLHWLSHLLGQFIPKMFSSTNTLFGKHTEIKHFLLSKLSTTMMSAQHPCEVGKNQLFSEAEKLNNFLKAMMKNVLFIINSLKNLE